METLFEETFVITLDLESIFSKIISGEIFSERDIEFISVEEIENEHILKINFPFHLKSIIKERVGNEEVISIIVSKIENNSFFMESYSPSSLNSYLKTYNCVYFKKEVNNKTSVNTVITGEIIYKSSFFERTFASFDIDTYVSSKAVTEFERILIGIRRYEDIPLFRI